MPRFYDPNFHNPDHHYDQQKRIPKGHEGGGRWTDEDFHPELVRGLRAPPRVMPPPPPRVLPPLGPAEPQVTPPPFGRPGLEPLTIEALGKSLRDAADRYEQLSRHDTAEKRTVATFRSREFFYGDPAAVQVRVLNAEQVEAVCKKLKEVQSLVDWADAATPPTGPGFNEAQRGTRIHTGVAHEINGHVNPGEPPKDLKFRAETSVVRTLEAMGLDQDVLRKKHVTEGWGKPGTRRFDVLEFPNDQTVCVFEIKTADALLSRKDMEHFAELLSNYGHKLIIVTQVKPSYMYRK